MQQKFKKNYAVVFTFIEYKTRLIWTCLCFAYEQSINPIYKYNYLVWFFPLSLLLNLNWAIINLFLLEHSFFCVKYSGALFAALFLWHSFDKPCLRLKYFFTYEACWYIVLWENTLLDMSHFQLKKNHIILFTYFAGFKCLKKFVGRSMVLLFTAAFTLGLPFGLMVLSGNALIQNNLHNFAFNV